MKEKRNGKSTKPERTISSIDYALAGYALAHSLEKRFGGDDSPHQEHFAKEKDKAKDMLERSVTRVVNERLSILLGDEAPTYRGYVIEEESID